MMIIRFKVGNHSLIEDEGGDEVRAWFPCPFCYVEIELPMLCVHLQEEHCFALKNAVISCLHWVPPSSFD